jgi:predicted amidophosphoribosyltransferase
MIAALAPDARTFRIRDERFQQCAFCGKDLVVLPNDRRGGACFDCLSLVGSDEIACPGCGAPLAVHLRVAGCGRCGWFPGR